jgi:hypothetical protein
LDPSAYVPRFSFSSMLPVVKITASNACMLACRILVSTPKPTCHTASCYLVQKIRLHTGLNKLGVTSNDSAGGPDKSFLRYFSIRLME